MMAMWMLMTLVKVLMLCTVKLTSLTAVINHLAEQENGFFPMEDTCTGQMNKKPSMPTDIAFQYGLHCSFQLV